MKKIKSGCIVLIVMVTTAFSCSKGPAGATGSAGAQGPSGPKGDTGVANVIYSSWMDVTYTPNADSSQWTTSIPAPKLSNAILTTGELKLYVNLNNAGQPVITPLPYFDGSNIINVLFELQLIDLNANINAGTFTSNGVKFQQYRYILIPGGVNGRSAIDWNNYAEVKKYLKLKD